MSRLEVQDVHADVDGQAFLQRITFDVPAGATHVLLGPSGCGKSTLLKALAGLHPATRGRILLDGVDVTREPPERRGLVLLHQENTLFPHLDVEGNIGFGLRLRGLAAPERARRVRELLDLVGLQGFQRRRTEGLSGGERQRVALARALAVEPRVLLLDEPFSALDRLLRQGLREDLSRILHERGVTALYVTHDQEEAFALGDGLLVMSQGRLIDRGAVAHVFREPQSHESAQVLGRENVWPAGSRPRFLPQAWRDDPRTLLVREEELRVAPQLDGAARILSAQFLGARTRYVVEDGVRVRVEQPGPPAARAGERVQIDWSRAQPHFFQDGGSKTQHP